MLFSLQQLRVGPVGVPVGEQHEGVSRVEARQQALLRLPRCRAGPPEDYPPQPLDDQKQNAAGDDGGQSSSSSSSSGAGEYDGRAALRNKRMIHFGF